MYIDVDGWSVRGVCNMGLMHEIAKAIAGKKSRVRITQRKIKGIKEEARLEQKGYDFAFGTGFENRKDMIDHLPDQPAAKEAGRQ
jgi:hypothetical protein